MPKEIKQTRFLKHSPQEVWECLTKPELLAQWLMKTDFQPRVGHKFSVINKEGKITECEVLQIIPNKLLAYSWQVKKTSGEITMDSKVIWTLAEKKGGTELELHHNGFMMQVDFDSHSAGWENCLRKLEELSGNLATI